MGDTSPVNRKWGCIPHMRFGHEKARRVGRAATTDLIRSQAGQDSRYAASNSFASARRSYISAA